MTYVPDLKADTPFSKRLDRLFFEGKNEGTLIECGANDGLTTLRTMNGFRITCSYLGVDEWKPIMSQGVWAMPSFQAEGNATQFALPFAQKCDYT